MNIEKINRRAARGAKLLDAKRPGWFRSIVLDILDIREPYYCVLGQLDGYDVMIDELFCAYGGMHKEQIRHGFDVSEKAYLKGNVTERFRCLTDAWKREITDRLNAEQN